MLTPVLHQCGPGWIPAFDGMCGLCTAVFPSPQKPTFNLICTDFSYNTIQILLSTPHGGFSETIIIIKILKRYSKIIDKQLFRVLLKQGSWNDVMKHVVLCIEWRFSYQIPAYVMISTQ